MGLLTAVKAFTAVLRGKNDGPALETARRDRLASVMGATPEEIGAAMRSALSGDQEGFAKLCAIFDNYLLKEPRLRAVVEKRRRKIIQWPWRVAPADPDDAAAVADAEFVESVFRGIPRFSRTVLWELTDAVGKGFAAVQITGAVRDGRLVVDRASGVPQWALRHPVDPASGAPDMTRWEFHDARPGMGWTPVPDGKLLVFTREEQGSYLTGGLMWPTIWYACFKNFTIKDWLGFIEVYGIPIRIGKVPSEFKPGSREWETVATAVVNAASDSGAVISKEAEILVMDAMKGAASESFKAAAQYFDDAQAELWLGGTLTTSAGDKGTRALGDVHLDEEYALIMPDTEELAETLTEFGRMLTIANFGERPAYARFEFDAQLPKDLEAASRAVVPILQLGVPADLDGLYDTFMPWAKPRDGGDVFRANATVNPAIGAPAEPIAGRLAALSAIEVPGSFPGDDLVDGLAASAAGRARAAYEAFIDALNDMGDATANARSDFEAAIAGELAALICAGRIAGAVHAANEAVARDPEIDARQAVAAAAVAMAKVPAALSGMTLPRHARLAAIDLSGDGPILPRDESGRIVWSRVQPRAAMEWWARRAGFTASEFDALDEAAQERAFTIAGMESRNVIDSAHAEIDRALSQGATVSEFKKAMKAAGWTDTPHIEQVFTQNILSAYGAGREASLTSPEVMRYLPNSTLHTQRDAFVRPEHRVLDGITLRSDDPARKKLATPMYYGCRCYWTVARRDARLTEVSAIPFPPADQLWGAS